VIRHDGVATVASGYDGRDHEDCPGGRDEHEDGPFGPPLERLANSWSERTGAEPGGHPTNRLTRPIVIGRSGGSSASPGDHDSPGGGSMRIGSNVTVTARGSHEPAR
jgi:hypothetical protein